MTLNECQEMQMRTLNPEIDSSALLVIKEAGDCLWYLSLLARACGVTLEEVVQRNIDKLAARYPGQKFDAERSRSRTE